MQALLERVEVLGLNEIRIYPSVEAEARGWAAAMHDTTSADGALVNFVRRVELEAVSRSAAS